MTEKEETQLKEKIVRAIKTVHDPEIPVDVYELGLIYDIQILPINNVHILMTLTQIILYKPEFLYSIKLRFRLTFKYEKIFHNHVF